MNHLSLLLALFAFCGPAQASSFCEGQSISCSGMGCGDRSESENYNDANECANEFDSSSGCYYQRGVCSEYGTGVGGPTGKKGCTSSDSVLCPGMGCGSRSEYESYSYANECTSEFDGVEGCYFEKGICTL